MNANINIDDIRLAVRQGEIEWQKHCLQRMLERDVSRQEVMNVILNGEKIEDYPQDWPFPSALFFTGTEVHRSLHVVAAFNMVLKRPL